MNNQECSVNNIYRLDGSVPLLKAIPFGLQHILAMFVSNLTPITIIAASGNLPQMEISVLPQICCLERSRWQSAWGGILWQRDI